VSGEDEARAAGAGELGPSQGQLPTFEQLRELMKGRVLGWNEGRDFVELMFPDFARIRDREFEEFVTREELRDEHVALVEAAQAVLDREREGKEEEAGAAPKG
jgi:hypothetical protein